MKVVILAGGFGTRLSEYTDVIPKPMVSIGGKPILWHIMNHYASYGHNDFYIALGYKSEVIKDYFIRYYETNSDFTIDLSNGDIEVHNKSKINWKVTLVNTGLDSMTGGRLKRLKEFVGLETFMLTYGDGLSNVNINSLVNFHNNHNKMVTLTSVRPQARFGELKLVDDKVINFSEKPSMHDGWINGGYFVINPQFLDYIDGDDTILEKKPLETVAGEGRLMAFKHDGFWQCMDTKRDRDLLETLWSSGSAPWV